jgi:hypothetical protein
MNWTEKKAILARLGHTGFASEDHYDEWFSELDRVAQTPIRMAMCNAEEYGTPTFNWGRNYFKTAKTTQWKKVLQ